MEGPSSNEKDISVAEMRLLITAVISFKSDEIVTAILNVEKLKAALKLQLSKTVSVFFARGPLSNSEVHSLL